MRRQAVSKLRGRGAALALLCAALLLVLPEPASPIDLSSGDFKFNWDNTISWGARYRLSDQDERLIGLANGGTAYSVNGDDGNLNFDKGITSNAIKLTTEIDMAYKNVGAFVRASGFYDYELMQNDRERTPLTEDAEDWAGSRFELLDAYAWWKFRMGSVGGQLRAGEQVISWGESTFIQGGINVINPVDVGALRVPGAELREALRPIGAVWASFGLTDSLSFEGFYQYRWEEVVIDPAGTYFSTNDFAGRGGQFVGLGFGSPSMHADSPFFIQPPLDRPFLGVPRAKDIEPADGGQYGGALRWLLGETEFGFYFINYHSRLPSLNGISGTLQGLLGAGPAAAAAAGNVYAFFGVPPNVSPAVDAIAQQAASAAATDNYSSTARYQVVYPEDIKLYGLSFNTQLGTSGVALQGEASYKQDVPYAVDDVELLFASLTPLNPVFKYNQLRPNGVGLQETIPGYLRLDSTQVQATGTKVFGPGMGADQSLLLLEAAVTHVHDFPDKSVLRMEGPGTFTSGNPFHYLYGAHAGKEHEEARHFADATSWGYRLVGRMDFFNVIGPWNLQPRFGWQHDVAGVSPAPGGNFIEGRTALTLGCTASYQNSWEIDLSYTNYDGAGRYNLINDRDFVGTSVKYSF